MERENNIAFKEFNIWLLADSSSENFKNRLDLPLDDRHGAVHNIWTPIIDKVQDILYRNTGKRIDTSKIYIRNAVVDKEDWKNTTKLDAEMKAFCNIIQTTEEKTRLIFTFGAKAYEFVQRCETYMNIKNNKTKNLNNPWTTLELGYEFKQRIENFQLNKINFLPLLHITISRGEFMTSHKNFCKGLGIQSDETRFNYFEETSKLIANLIIDNQSAFDIWIK